MKTNALLLIIAISIATTSYGQITGKIINKTNEAIPFVNVVLYQASDTLILKGTYTDEKGVFSLPLVKEGVFLIGVSSVGYQSMITKPITVSLQNEALDIGVLQMVENINTLNEVVVSTKKNLIQTTPVGQVINVQSSLMTKGSSALQVLERLPGVIIDYRNNSFSLNGQSGVAVMINGRTVRLSLTEVMAMLNGMNADNIDKIEIITSPTAQYDAEGGAGLINIVLKKNEYEGTKLSFSSTLGYGFGEKAAASINLSHGTKNSNYYASYSMLHDEAKSSWQAYGALNFPALGGAYTSGFYSATINLKNSHNLSLGFDHRLNPKTLVGGSITYLHSTTKPNVQSDGFYDFQSGNYFAMKINSLGNNLGQNVQSSAFLEKQLSIKSKLNIDASYWYFRNNSPSLINSTYYNKAGNIIKPSDSVFTEGNRGEGLSELNIGVLKGDFSTKLTDKINVETGIKGSYSSNTNNSKVEKKEHDVWVLDSRSQSTVISNESILAAYSSFDFTLSPKISFTTGLRYEYWARDINHHTNTYSQFFPSLNFTHKIAENSSYVVSLSRRISRPAYNDLISGLFYNDPSSVFTGNPLLKPSITNAFKTTFTHKNISVGLGIQQEVNPIIRYQLSTTAAKDIFILSPQNLDYMNSVSLTTNVPIQLFSWWKITIGGTTAYRKYKVGYTPQVAEKAYLFHNYFLNQSVSLPHNIEVEITGWHNTNQFDGPNMIKGFGVMNLGIAKKLDKDRGTIQLAITDIFKSMNIYTEVGVVTPVVFIENNKVHYMDETAYARIFKLSYSRSFGSTVRSRSKTNNVEEEGSRIR
ncbi:MULTISPECIES: TonB-dependent receptor domain-containing protein [unclassified Arcicella]|uniref:TonB-dependent receptor domain-containing protein n=1 Tax=unclassified Arcicella TaxID=2644986 RepID=UPI0028647821|nr:MULTISPECIES: TonB-dependent receptor [unclassified Arcicella]MDR6562779.1 hypothetical protein [Arcicella sp. BE51]MDR6812877.1 hypothetical protein [Arcicella sp. BE140]MDR6824191.1 hypothetical protein [Arcicella sp. BE139]